MDLQLATDVTKAALIIVTAALVLFAVAPMVTDFRSACRKGNRS